MRFPSLPSRRHVLASVLAFGVMAASASPAAAHNETDGSDIIPGSPSTLSLTLEGHCESGVTTMSVGFPRELILMSSEMGSDWETTTESGNSEAAALVLRMTKTGDPMPAGEAEVVTLVIDAAPEAAGMSLVTPITHECADGTIKSWLSADGQDPAPVLRVGDPSQASADDPVVENTPLPTPVDEPPLLYPSEPLDSAGPDAGEEAMDVIAPAPGASTADTTDTSSGVTVTITESSVTEALLFAMGAVFAIAMAVVVALLRRCRCTCHLSSENAAFPATVETPLTPD